MKNIKNFNIYVFLSTFSRNLIEAFIGTLLFKVGFGLKDVILFYLIVCILSLILTYPLVYISKKKSNRLLAIIGIISFVLLQLLLNNVKINYLYLFIIALVNTLYRVSYWLSRRFYNFKVIKSDNIAKSYSIISIVNQLAAVASAYIGSLLLDFISIKVLTIISISLFIFSLYPLYKLKFEHEFNNTKLNLFKTIKSLGFSNIYLFGSYEVYNIIKFIFPLYIFIYVKNTYHTIGILLLISNVATMITSYLYGKKINGDKNYLKIAIVLTVIIYMFKANTFGLILVIVSFLEGMIVKIFEISINKNIISLSKKYDYYNYNLAYEFVLCIFRTIVTIIIYFIIGDLKMMIYFTLLIILLSVFFNFKNSDIKVELSE